ncbi:protein-L-isoaspartate(D-aspartate) O-methyltransferase [Piscinibacter gummiphilus]|uniref:protein-L-isoaspartate(D-aspartate) O-methyltransferase n=1 Tax=Piscinibacter gummiphilus TaxID=946333 RepID=UPI000A267F20|nr:protein-L-isoaspartate(D-aspartate) O-methyltransferase [Piscinibacter gummiphilus]ATU68597.1 protein-L-isoaspartate(D-aspartate) O-methyltransferase [Piscinibacter gummiphilus]GLS96323.1 protein-L-isoaspartate O-methyltransferase [Piscinibacter gummiphilus]
MSQPPQRPKFPLQLEGLDRPVRRPTSVPVASPKPVATPVAGAIPRVEPRPVLRPQQPLQQAALDSARRVAPSGLGLDSAGIRKRMVDRLVAAGLRDELVKDAMSQVPRHVFVDTALVNQAYEDTSLPIGLGQTISKPSVVARMIELLMAGANARTKRSLGQALEIGTGCGYQAAVLARLSRQVMSIERLRPLHDKARENLAPLRQMNIRLVYGDGMRGHPPNAPYDSIISAAGGEALPDAWLAQLAVGGRLVAPVHDASGARQVLVVVDRTDEGFTRSVHEAVHFVPLKSGLD